MSAMAGRQTVSRWGESETPPRTQPEIGDDGCWLAGLAGEDDYCIRLSITVSV